MQKLKAVFHSSSKKRAQDSDESRQHHSDTTTSHLSRNDRRATSLDERRPRQSSEAAKAGAQHHGRSRPLSSVYDPRGTNTASGAQPAALDSAQVQHSEAVSGSIASDYKAYLPALSPVHDSQDEQYRLGHDRRLTTGESENPHEEDVADRNIDRYRNSLDVSRRKPLPATPVLGVPGGREIDQKHSVDSGNTSWPSETARAEPQASWSIRRPRASESEDDEPHLLPKDSVDRQHLPLRSNGTPRQTRIAADGHEDIEREIEQLLDGVVDLRNTVDEDKDVQWAPAVTHEVVKTHEHEIIQHKIFREIHDYEYYHHIQPVYNLEILPPRHWIPNPDGQGLIEISADELPSRTGNNRRWKIVHEQVELPAESRAVWRTEPEVIEHPTTVTAEGFERKETTIIYPPTLQDMSEYDGPVQPVHFDHKTGKRWLGEITTMHKLRHELGQVSDPDLSLKELGRTLPDVSEVSQVPDLSQSPSLKRKPLTGPVPAQVGGRNQLDGVAIAV